MIEKMLGLAVGAKAMAPPPFEKEPVTIIGFRYHTGRHSGRTAMVADYVTPDGKQAFDTVERLKPIDEPNDALSLVRDMRDAIIEAHDTHIFSADDSHPADCQYCKLVARANALLS